MEDSINFIEDCSHSFQCYYNMGDKGNNSNKVILSKVAVEKFVFNKIYPTLFELYNDRYRENNELFIKRQQLIREKYTYDKIIEYLGVS